MKSLFGFAFATLLVATGCHHDSSGNDDLGIDADGFSFDTDSGQWVPTDGGPIQLLEGGVLIHDDGGTFACYPTTCQGKLLACGDCMDNDGDGRIDWRDPECLGPCDNTEGPALEAGVGGVGGNSCKVDCYFDYGNGPGNDDCYWDHRCDPLAPEAPLCVYDAALVGGKDCPPTVSQTCLNVCRPLTPNGCDCFGCCTFPQIPGKFVWIGALDTTNVGTCTFADLNDQSKCPACTPRVDCFNDCGHCELCVGKPDLPSDCLATPTDGSTPPARCPAGVQTCGLPGEALCPANYYCITGCCQQTITVL